jgi:hypothetical protein
MITDYKLLEVPNNRELQQEVNRFIDQGWEPFGSPVVSSEDEVQITYAQAIVKRQPESEELEGLRMKLAEVNLATTAGLMGTISEREALEDITRLFKATERRG